MDKRDQNQHQLVTHQQKNTKSFYFSLLKKKKHSKKLFSLKTLAGPGKLGRVSKLAFASSCHGPSGQRTIQHPRERQIIVCKMKIFRYFFLIKSILTSRPAQPLQTALQRENKADDDTSRVRNNIKKHKKTTKQNFFLRLSDFVMCKLFIIKKVKKIINDNRINGATFISK